MNKNLLILGAGQYGTVVKEIAKSMNCFEKIDFLDDSFGMDNPNYHEEAIGKIEMLDEHRVDYFYAIPAIGDPDKRLELLEALIENGYQIPVLVSPKAYVSPLAQLQKGAVVEPLAGIHANVVIGEATYISMGAVVNHNAIVLNGCHIDCNAVVMSGALVASKTDVAPGEIVRKQALKLTLDKDGHIIQEPMESFPQGHDIDFE